MNKYRQDLKINKHELDEELIEQPQRYMEYIELAAEAAAEKDDAADALEITKAIVEDLIRTDPEKFGLEEKPKEGAIKAAIIKHPRVQRANKRLRKARKTLRILEGAKSSFEQRKTMLSKLVDYRIAGFYSEPRIKRTTQNKMEKDTAKGIRETMKKRKIRRR